MSHWVDRFASHPLWTSVRELQTKLDQFGAAEAEEMREGLEYASVATAMADARRRSTAPIMVTPKMLETSDAAVQQVIDELNRADEPDFNMTTTTRLVDAMVSSFANWPPPTGETVSEAVTEHLERLSVQTTELISQLAAKRDELVRRTAELEAEQGRLAETLSAAATRNEELISDFSAKSETLLSDQTESWLEARNEQEGAARETLLALSNWESQAQGIVHSTTGVATATDFGKYARNQGIVAALYDVVAGLVGIAGVGSLIVHLYQVGEVGSDLSLSLTRLAASLGTLGIAGIIGARGGQHHAEARAAKRTDLTLRRIEPFTANLDPDTKQAIIEETTARIFIRGELNQAGEDHKSIAERVRERARELRQRRAPRDPEAN